MTSRVMESIEPGGRRSRIRSSVSLSTQRLMVARDPSGFFAKSRFVVFAPYQRSARAMYSGRNGYAFSAQRAFAVRRV
ncbi:hypothetical protein DSECCO2_618340 [anaerobic digester metagenome]